ncbi:MAG: hypothetical protein EBZ69_02690, partial [Alphaproteobacteria bacterium]|nr:hypothetical protein [Alphaproteobacteria bacterium]
GAGLAGLSTALYAGLGGLKTTLYEGTLHAGGRCRSYDDRELGCRIDNGNHLMLSGNIAVLDYVAQCGAADTLTSPAVAHYPFFDVRTRAHWRIRFNRGKIPLWALHKKSRAPETSVADYLSLGKFLWAPHDQTIQQLFPPHHPLYEKLIEPLTLAIHNTHPAEASAGLMRNVLMQSFFMGAEACRPLMPVAGLSESLVDPCLAKLPQLGGAIKFGRRLRGVILGEDRIISLDFTDGLVHLDEHDWVVLATPGWVTSDLLPSLTIPNDYRAIINVHFRQDVPRNDMGFTGFIGGVCQWVFVKPGVVSVTISAGDEWINAPSPDLAARCWADIATLYGLDAASVPPYRIVKEKRATFAATPAQLQRRPTACTPWRNLLLAGDYTDTALPSTIEGSLRSGLKAAQILLRWVG